MNTGFVNHFCWYHFKTSLSWCFCSKLNGFTLVNDETVLYLTIQFSIRHLFEHSLIVKHFYLTSGQDAIIRGQSGPGNDGNEWVLSIPQSSRRFCFISKTLGGDDLNPMQRCSRCILQPQPMRGSWRLNYIIKRSYNPLDSVSMLICNER